MRSAVRDKSRLLQVVHHIFCQLYADMLTSDKSHIEGIDDGETTEQRGTQRLVWHPVRARRQTQNNFSL